MDIALCTDLGWLLSEEAFLIYASCMYKPSFAEFKTHIESCLDDPFVKIYVCAAGGERAGILILRKQAPISEVVGIAVSQRFRRRGIGKSMLLRVMEKELLTAIKAETDEDATGFYQKCGFSEAKEIHEYPDGKAVRYICCLHV